ncbi:MAG: hypothetical protein Q4D98_07415 [Planctomycetia bacterium]|nr:hypothetical protein [Planctomycetia bacterium]
MSDAFQENGADDPFADVGEAFPEETTFEEAAQDAASDEAPAEDLGAAVPLDKAAAKKTMQYRRPRMDLYTVLLLLALVFISAAAAIHYFECSPYEYGTPPYKEGSPIARPAE